MVLVIGVQVAGRRAVLHVVPWEAVIGGDWWVGPRAGPEGALSPWDPLLTQLRGPESWPGPSSVGEAAAFPQKGCSQ